jgi:uncharacterized protein YbcV (DUF1398 family)
MFTIDQIKTAHAKVKSGADFPAYVQELIVLGITNYDSYVTDGHSVYFGKNNHHVTSDAKYPVIKIAAESDIEKFKHYLKIHQQGQTSYPEFCKHAAEAGVEKWTVDTTVMTCIYYGTKGNEMLLEIIPTA